jgi:hypothetical protein
MWSTGIADLGMTSAEADPDLCYCRGAVGGVGPHAYHGTPRNGIDYTDPTGDLCTCDHTRGLHPSAGHCSGCGCTYFIPAP